MYIGVFAENIASTAIRISCRYSALCEDITGIDPEPIVIPDVGALNAKIEELTANNAELTASNTELKAENAELEARVDELTASIKPEQEKAVTITENGTTEVLPDENKTLSKVAITVDVETGNPEAEATLAEIEGAIDESGVLDSTDGTATEKVEQLIDKSNEQNLWYAWSENYAVANVTPQMFNGYKGTQLPKFDFSKITNTSRFLYGAVNVTTIDFYINCENSTNGSAMFYSTKALTKMKGFNSSKMTIITQCLMNSGIEEIELPFDFSNVTNNLNWLNGCNALRKILFVKETIKVSITIPSPVLSDESIQSIIDGLATVETAQTLTINSNIFLALTNEQLATIKAKGWNVE